MVLKPKEELDEQQKTLEDQTTSGLTINSEELGLKQDEQDS